MVNNHGDRKSPKDRVVGPLPKSLNGIINGLNIICNISWWLVSTHLKNMLIKLDHLGQARAKVKDISNQLGKFFTISIQEFVTNWQLWGRQVWYLVVV